jgi:transposase
VKVGRLSRGGTSRTLVEALDHDFRPDDVVVPIGIFVPKTGELFICVVRTPATADAIADAIENWWRHNRVRYPGVERLVIDQDNGPENNSHRTQFMARMVQLADGTTTHIELAYYPPYHSKYNPIERCWAWLEKYWNGALLDSIEAVVGWASNMMCKGRHPVVQFVERTYTKGVTLNEAAMTQVEARLQRHSTLGRWFVDIAFATP